MPVKVILTYLIQKMINGSNKCIITQPGPVFPGHKIESYRIIQRSCHSSGHALFFLPSFLPSFLPPDITSDTHAELIYDSLHSSRSAYMRHLWSSLRPPFMWRTQNGLCGYVSDRSFLALTANIVCSPLISICKPLLNRGGVINHIFKCGPSHTDTQGHTDLLCGLVCKVK